MNLGGLFLIFIIVVGAVFGLILISNKAPQVSELKDTYGNMAGNQSNQSQSEITNLTSTGTQVGAGAAVLVVLIIGAVVLGALVLVATKKI
jgi:ABC-type transport system involved in multi-copper enzyme maturation permease subunit